MITSWSIKQNLVLTMMACRTEINPSKFLEMNHKCHNPIKLHTYTQEINRTPISYTYRYIENEMRLLFSDSEDVINKTMHPRLKFSYSFCQILNFGVGLGDRKGFLPKWGKLKYALEKCSLIDTLIFVFQR